MQVRNSGRTGSDSSGIGQADNVGLGQGVEQNLLVRVLGRTRLAVLFVLWLDGVGLVGMSVGIGIRRRFAFSLAIGTRRALDSGLQRCSSARTIARVLSAACEAHLFVVLRIVQGGSRRQSRGRGDWVLIALDLGLHVLLFHPSQPSTVQRAE